MKRLFSRIHDQRGFTLIELLVVVAILGVIAAILVPNVSKFVGVGRVEGANTESHNVQTAVVAYIVDADLSDFDGDVGPETANGPEEFLMNAATLQAVYTFEDCSVTGAATVEDSKWGDLVYTVGVGWHEPD